MLKSKNPAKILFADIETTPLQAWVWHLGKQVVRHQQLVAPFDEYKIICICYAWNDGKPAKAMSWRTHSQQDMLVDFMKLVDKADLLIGKNSDRFDWKQIKFRALREGVDSSAIQKIPTDDLEKQLRKHFYLPSYSLDYVSKILGHGGKIKMELDDWIQIIVHNSIMHLKKMVKYCKKDVIDSRDEWEFCEGHFTPKYNNANTDKGVYRCARPGCGSTNIIRNGQRRLKSGLYQHFNCLACVKEGRPGYCGRATVNEKTGQFGKIRL